MKSKLLPEVSQDVILDVSELSTSPDKTIFREYLKNSTKILEVHNHHLYNFFLDGLIMFSKYGNHDLSKFGVHDESHGFSQGSIMMHNLLFAQALSDHSALGEKLKRNTYTYTLPIVEEGIINTACLMNIDKPSGHYTEGIKSLLRCENKTLLYYIEGLEYSNGSFKSGCDFGWASIYHLLRLQALENSK